ncbi:MAG: cupin domain-containing protein, partial [Candidatus Dormiibacterota bacterium]
MTFWAVDDMQRIEPVPGWRGRIFHSEHVTYGVYDIAGDAPPVHEHHHSQEEVWIVVDGEIAVTVEGDTRTLRAGESALIPPDAWHAVRALTAARAIVSDYP